VFTLGNSSANEENVEQLDIGYSTPVEKSPVEILAAKLRQDWGYLAAARERAVKERRRLQSALRDLDGADSSIVVFGSLGRDEFTVGSDVDWTLLVDGIADPAHFDTALEIRRRLEKLGHEPPGREGIFGNLAFSHNLIHQIGGEDDSNSNTTRRILLLSESQVIGRREAHERTLHNILHRYLYEDRGLWYGSGEFRIPRFLLNDIVRYWRTMAVDFAYKQRTRGNEGFALRNIKLRMSRKLIFISGMLACFSCHLDLTPEEKELFFGSKAVQPVVDHLQKTLSLPPLQLIAKVLLKHEDLWPPASALFSTYDTFIGMLADESLLSSGMTRRKHLDKLPVEELEDDEVFQEARELSHRFRDAVHDIFLRSKTDLSRLTIEYGVF
jgi:predicted nucleotidyltransferase